MAARKIRVTQVRSAIGQSGKHRGTLRALGLGRIGRAAEHQEQLAELERILSTLGSEQRNVFVLFEIEKLTGEEIAEALGIPLGTVYSRLQLARKAFRAELERTRARERHGSERARAAHGGGRA